MPLTERLYAKSQSAINVAATPSTTPSISLTVSLTPSITPTITITPSISVTPTLTPTVTPTPSITPSPGFFYLSNVYNCDGFGNCGSFVGQSVIYNPSSDFIFGRFYINGSNVYQVLSLVAGYAGSYTLVNPSTSYDSCELACNTVLVTSPTVTPTPSTSAVPPSVTPSQTPSLTPSTSVVPPSATPSQTPSLTPTVSA